MGEGDESGVGDGFSGREEAVENRRAGEDFIVGVGDERFQVRVAVDARREVVNGAVCVGAVVVDVF